MTAGSRFIVIGMIFNLSFCFVPAAFSAFHSGGVGSCQGCHNGGHGSENGMQTSTASASPLLKASDPSSICLNCHAGPGGPTSPSVFSFDGSALTPGGDFYWLTKTFTWNGGESPAASHGHNVVARDFGLEADPLRALAPGGTYPSSALGCTSCHDPHGRSSKGTAQGGLPLAGSGSYGAIPAPGTEQGSYRMLGGAGYVSNGFSFTNSAPVARQNPALPFAESDTSHVDYGSGMSAWCGNCHNGILNSSHKAGGGFEHPVDEPLGTELSGSYNSYLSSGNLNGINPTAFLQFVPFERGANDPQLLDPTSTNGPEATAVVTCLTCHRAHATAFSAAGRWDFGAPLLVDSHPAAGDSGVSGNDVNNSYYGRDITTEFGAAQGQFCEKCHSSGTP